MTDTERAPVMMRRTSRGLEPVASFDLERLDRYSFGTDLEVRIMQRRSLPQQRLYWAMLTRVVDNADGWPSAEHLHEAIKLHLGYSEPLRTIDGRIAWRAESTAFSKMDGSEFRVFFDRAVEVISTVILPGVDPIALVEEGRASA